MKKSKLIYTAIAAALLAGAIGASAQSDSSNVPALRGNPVVCLTLQERETPLVQHIYPVTRVQPNTYFATGSNSGNPNTTAFADCGSGGIMISGGGTCIDYEGFTAMAASAP